MPYTWKVFGLNRRVNIDPSFIENLENLFDVSLSYKEDLITPNGQDIRSILEDGRNTIDNGLSVDYNNKYIIDGRDFQCIFSSRKRSPIDVSSGPMLLCCYGGDSQINVLLDWLKDNGGTIIWPLKFPPKEIINLLDSSLSGRKWYDTRFIFQDNSSQDISNNNDSNINNNSGDNSYDYEDDIDEENGKKRSMLEKYSIELSKYSCSNLCKRYDGDRYYDDIILPYIESKTGMHIVKLPIKMVILINLMTITSESIITQRPELPDKLLCSLFNLVNSIEPI